MRKNKVFFFKSYQVLIDKFFFKCCYFIHPRFFKISIIIMRRNYYCAITYNDIQSIQAKKFALHGILELVVVDGVCKKSISRVHMYIYALTNNLQKNTSQIFNFLI